MKPSIACHEWLVGACCADAEAQSADPVTFWIDAHRNRRGPFTATGNFIRVIIDQASRAVPDLVATHLLTLLTVAPEVGDYVPVAEDVRQALSVSCEGNPPSWTGRIANGAADFILGYFEAKPASCQVAIFANVDNADPTDREFIAVLLRRADPGKLRLCVCTASDRLSSPLAAALKQYAVRRLVKACGSGDPEMPPAWAAWFAACRLSGEKAVGLRQDLAGFGHERIFPLGSHSLGSFLDESIAKLSAADREALAWAHVNADGTTGPILAQHVYRRLPALERKAMHLARAAALVSLGKPSLLLGAIPFHYEQAGEGAETLLTASRICLDMACYDAALDWSVRGRRMLSGLS
jgi:hypothetical protein